MPAVEDHIRRDALHAARSDIRVALYKFVRRLDREASTAIESSLANAQPGAELDGESIGREAARAAIASYLAPGEPQPAIDAAPGAHLLASQDS